MTDYVKIKTVLDEFGLPYAYYQFKEAPVGDAYIAYFETGKNRMLADDKVYLHESSFAVELYTKTKDPTLEESLISAFEDAELVWSGGETTYIDSEKMYQTIFYL